MEIRKTQPQDVQKTMKKHLGVLSLTVGLSLVAGLSAQAQNLASESFNYAPGANVINSTGNGGTGWGAFVWNSKSETATLNLSPVMAGSLGYTDGSGNTLTTSGGSLVSMATNSTTAQPQRAFTGTLAVLSGATATAGSGTIWASYLWQGLNTPATSGGLYRQSIMMFVVGATASTGSGSERLDIGMPNISTANQATVNPNISMWLSGGISGGNGTLSSTAPQQSAVAANNGVADFILVQFLVDTLTTTADTVKIWINPTLDGNAPVGTPDLTWTTQDLSAVNGIRIQSGGLNATYGTVGGAQQVDEFNLGLTVASVEPVPEPASMALIGLGGLALLALRRKQS